MPTKPVDTHGVTMGNTMANPHRSAIEDDDEDESPPSLGANPMMAGPGYSAVPDQHSYNPSLAGSGPSYNPGYYDASQPVFDGNNAPYFNPHDNNPYAIAASYAQPSAQNMPNPHPH